jgi:glycosyltransferase involved in cell wall biosynthesis
MQAGSGTNIKMFDYMAAGLPVVTTEIGARGIGTIVSAPTGIFVEVLEGFPARCVELAKGDGTDVALREAVRDTVRRCYSWERISQALGNLLSATFARQHEACGPRIAIMSTWNITCGIGEHSMYLEEALTEAGARVLVLGNSIDGHQPLGFERDLHTAVSRIWQWDNLTWRRSAIDLTRMHSVLSLANIELLIIQHHTGYLPASDVEAVIDAAAKMGNRVIMEMHDARNVSSEDKNRFCAAGAALVVHHVDETFGISGKYANNISVLIHPTRIPAHKGRSDARHNNGSIVIGGFGFLRPYKGLPMVIDTLAILRKTFPEISYKGWHAMYPGDESEKHLQECFIQAEKLGVLDAIEIHTEFLPIDEVVRNLSSVDVVILAYDPSDEGASGAVQHALAAGCPVVTSPSKIFRSVADLVCVVSQHAPLAYAKLIEKVLSDRDLAAKLNDRATAWVEANSYTRAAKVFLELGLTQTPNL